MEGFSNREYSAGRRRPRNVSRAVVKMRMVVLVVASMIEG